MAKTSLYHGDMKQGPIVCLLPRISMIKHNNSNVTTRVRILNYNHSIKKFCMRKTLTNQWWAYQTLVVTTSNDKNTICMPKIILPSVAPQLQGPKSRQKTKSITLPREQVMLCLKWGSTSSIYIIQMTLNYKIGH